MCPTRHVSVHDAVCIITNDDEDDHVEGEHGDGVGDDYKNIRNPLSATVVIILILLIRSDEWNHAPKMVERNHTIETEQLMKANQSGESTSC